jgi:hypothetical protein
MMKKEIQRVWDEPDRNNLAHALLELERLTSALRRQGQVIATSTITTVAGSIAILLYRFFQIIEATFLLTLVIVLTTGLVALLLTVIFESRRNRAMSCSRKSATRCNGTSGSETK